MLFPADVTSFLPWIWAGLVVLFFVIETATQGLTTIWFALSALVLVFVSFTPLGVRGQILLFVAIAAALLVFTRPLAVRLLKKRPIHTNADRLVGQKAVVTKTIPPLEKGEVKIEGALWSAKSDQAPLDTGTVCTVLRIEGVTLIVE